jgi:hypothetical protein
MEQIVKFAKINLEYETEYWKTSTALKTLFTDKEGCIKNKDMIVKVMMLTNNQDVFMLKGKYESIFDDMIKQQFDRPAFSAIMGAKRQRTD